MSAELTTIEFSDSQVDLLKRTICRGATNDELALFINQCKRTGLDPFTRQIHAVKRWDATQQREVMAIQTGIDGYRLVADRTEKYAGSDDPVFDREDVQHPGKATATVWKMVGGQRVPFTRSARWDEFVQTKKDGTVTRFWQRMPYLMLGKCAESLALRAAFPQELSGLYTNEEMPPVEPPSHSVGPVDATPAAITAGNDPPDAALVNELTEALNGCRNQAELADVKTTLSARKKDLTPAGQKHLAGIYNGLFGSLPAATDGETDDGYAGDHTLPGLGGKSQMVPAH